MGRFAVGQSPRRVEDFRLITGAGRYTDDIALDGQVHACFVRSPYANAKITALDVGDAKAAPGVLAVLTHEDVAAAGYGGLPCKGFIGENRDGSKTPMPAHPALAKGRVRYVGDPVAMVIAESAQLARDAAELVAVEYDVLPAVTDCAAALKDGAPQVHDDAPGNLVFDWETGDRAKVDELMNAAAHVVTVELVNNRLVPNSLEPRAAIGVYDQASDGYTLYTNGQNVVGMRDIIAQNVLNIDKDKLRVVIPDVGGGFGMKIFVFPEQPLVLLAAKTVGKPVRWIGDRSESFLADTHGRDHVTTVKLALDADGKFLALRSTNVANLGAYLSQYGPFIPTAAGAAMYAAVYTFQAVHYEVKGAFTHTTPVDAYRGAGRPEAAYVVERVVDAAARQLGVDPAELRKRNFIKDFPYTTSLGATYDSGDFARNLDDALQLADVSGFAARKAESERAGKLRGLGIAYYIEQCGGAPQDYARVEVGDQGVTVYAGNQSNGQGHETMFAQIVSNALGIEIEQVEVRQGDTDVVPMGGGTGGSRALTVTGAASLQAAGDASEAGKAIAADMLEAASADIQYADGRYTVAGTDRSVTLFEVAAKAGGLRAEHERVPDAATFPNGAHVCEVEVDPATGVATVVSYAVVDDFGVVLNPMLLQGQVHGGIGQGIGQALTEATVYDESGQLLSGSFMDYAMPRADHIPAIKFKYNEIKCTTNPIGAKGAGEAGAIGAPPAVINGIVDALQGYGVTHVDMPATPLRVWNLIHGSGQKLAAE